MGSTRVGVLISSDERNIARLNTADTPPSIYVPNQSNASSYPFSPITLGKSTNAFWTIPNGTFPMVGSPRWWNVGRCYSTASTSTVAIGSTLYPIPLSVARTATLLNVAVNATSVASTTSTIYACLFQMVAGGTSFSQIYNNVLTAGTTASGLRAIFMNTTLYAGQQYVLAFGGSGFTITTITDYGPPRIYPQTGTYPPSNTNYQGYQAAQLYMPTLASAPQNLSSFAWPDLVMTNGIGMPAAAVQLRSN
jgi:hypothetical protein